MYIVYSEFNIIALIEITLKSKISANMYGPLSQIARFGFIMSDKSTAFSPYRFLNNRAHSIPN